MALPGIVGQLQLLVKAAAPPVVEAEPGPELPKLSVGDRVTATVLSQLAGGGIRARIADFVVNLNLGAPAQEGQKLDLTVVTNSPKLAFALTQDLAATGASVGGGQGKISLSDAARFLGGLLDRLAQMKSEAEEGKSPLAATKPILNAPTGDTKSMAVALHQALNRSGLFYESHQAQWVEGKRPLNDLLQEPQGRLSNLVRQGADSSVPQAVGVAKPEIAASQMGRSDAGAVAKPDVDVAGGRAAQPSSPQQDVAASRAASPGGDPVRVSADDGKQAQPTIQHRDAVHPQTAGLIQQQLEALENRQILWQGQLWPGQQMQWEIDENGSNGGEDGEYPWQTRLTLTMPRLGSVSAVMAVNPMGVRIALAVDDKEALAAVREGQRNLAQGLAASGLKLAGFIARLDEPLP